MANERILYDFCPRCGGLTKNGVCTVCGHEKEAESASASGMRQDPESASASGTRQASEGASVFDAQQAPEDASVFDARQAPEGASVFDARQAPGGASASGTRQDPESVSLSGALQVPRHKIGRGVLAGACVGAAAFLFLFGVAVSLIVNGWRAGGVGSRDALAEEEPGPGPEEEKEQTYVPDPSDEYYVELADALREDLAYQISWVRCDEPEEDGAYYFGAVYPEIVGEFPNITQVNEKLKAMGLRNRSVYQYLREGSGTQSCEVFSSAYVTYMDEEVLSVAYAEYILLNGVYLPKIRDLNINVRTGELIGHEEMVSYTLKLAEKICSQNEYQNNVRLEDMGLTQEAVLALLKGEDGVAFYTPVGLELGFNYYTEEGDYGWLTATVKDYEEYGYYSRLPVMRGAFEKSFFLIVRREAL